MDKIDKFIDSLEPLEKVALRNEVIKRFNMEPEYQIVCRRNKYFIKVSGKYENINQSNICNIPFDTPEIAHLVYAIYLNTKNSLVDLMDNIKYVVRVLNLDSEWKN